MSEETLSDKTKAISLTKEQIKILDEMKKKNEYETIFICDECGEELKGMINVRKHVDKFKHYLYLKKDNPKCQIGFL